MADILVPPSSNGSITYTDGSPYVMIPKIVNASWNQGLAFKTDYSTKLATAQTTFLDTTNAPHVSAGTVTPAGVTEPTVSIPATASTTDIMTVFDTKYLELVALLADKFEVFRAEYFPDESNAYTAAEDWLQAAMANPNGGIPVALQEQLLGDNQARVLGEAARASDSVVAQFAARGFPLPPDVAANAVLQIQQKTQDEMAEASRKIMIMSIENMHFVVEKTLTLRQTAMDAAVKYIMALASGPEMASKVIGIGYDAQSKLISAASQFYGVRVQAAEMTNRVNQFNVSSSLEASTKNQMADLTLIEDKLKALLAEAQALAQMATSMFNNLHVSAGISGSAGNSVSYQYSNDTAAAAPTVTGV